MLFILCKIFTLDWFISLILKGINHLGQKSFSSTEQIMGLFVI